MRLSSITIPNLVGKRPKLEYGPPGVGEGGKFYISGRMIVQFEPPKEASQADVVYENVRGLTIEAPFTDAVDEDDAIRKAAEYLRRLGEDISAVAATLVQKF
jgi:hypothetical protein